MNNQEQKQTYIDKIEIMHMNSLELNKRIKKLEKQIKDLNYDFKNELIERLLDTLEIRKKETQILKRKILDWVIRLTFSGGLIFMIISKILEK
jgi:transcriptional regulator CtsR